MAADQSTARIAITPTVSMRMQEVELMHNYCVSAYKAFCHDAASTQWHLETFLPYALHHECVMDAVFALSACHLAQSRPQHTERLVQISTSYQDQSLRALTDALRAPAPDQVHAVASASMLMGVITLAQNQLPSSKGKDNSAASALLQVHNLWRGSGTIIYRSHDIVVKPELEDFWLNDPCLDEPLAPDLSFQDTMSKVRRLAAAHAETDGNHTPWRLSIDALELAYERSRKCPMPSPILAWTVRASEDFMSHLPSKHPVACLITLTYAVLVDMHRECWYVKDLGHRLVVELAPSIPVHDPEWLSVVEWAKKRVAKVAEDSK